MDLPVTPIRFPRLKNLDLSGYQVLVLPESIGSYDHELGEAGTKNLRDWVSDGGILIGLGNANRYLAHPKTDLTSIRRENAVIESEDDKKGGGKSDDDEERGHRGRELLYQCRRVRNCHYS